jgi:hypothetical protein
MMPPMSTDPADQLAADAERDLAQKLAEDGMEPDEVAEAVGALTAHYWPGSTAAARHRDRPWWLRRRRCRRTR